MITMEWKSIESAPKDGTAILGYGDIALSAYPVGVLVWNKDLGIWDADNDPDQGPWESEPTHWMPLPEPPK